jgi:uncharacterized membrane protein
MNPIDTRATGCWTLELELRTLSIGISDPNIFDFLLGAHMSRFSRNNLGFTTSVPMSPQIFFWFKWCKLTSNKNRICVLFLHVLHYCVAQRGVLKRVRTHTWPNSKSHWATRQQAIAKTPAKWSAYQIPSTSIVVVFVILVFKVNALILEMFPNRQMGVFWC